MSERIELAVVALAAFAHLVIFAVLAMDVLS